MHMSSNVVTGTSNSMTFSLIGDKKAIDPDIGSINSFIDYEFALKHGFKLSYMEAKKVTVAEEEN